MTDSIFHLARRHKLVYLATPYSKDKRSIHHAFVDACTFAAGLLKEGIKVYSPIAHTHPIALYGAIDPLCHEIWLPFDEAIMDVCEALIVAELPGWTESKGVQYESCYFQARNKPVYHLMGDCFA